MRTDVKRLAFAAVVCSLLTVSPSWATTFYTGLDNSVTDSSLVIPRKSAPYPAVNASAVPDPQLGAGVRRLTGDLLNVIAGTTCAVWGDQALNRNSTTQAWNADETKLLIEQSLTPSKIMLDSTGAAVWTSQSGETKYCAIMDSAEIVTFHPTEANVGIAWYQRTNKLVWFSVPACTTLRSWQIPIGGVADTAKTRARASLSTISDDGRWAVIATRYERAGALNKARNSARLDTAVVVDMMFPQNRVAPVDTLGGRVGAYVPLPPLPFTSVQGGGTGTSANGEVLAVDISTKGNYVAVKYAGTPEYQRVFHRGAGATLDTASFAMFPQTMAAAGLRSVDARDSTHGWVACMAGSDFNETSAGVEVLVGALRQNTNTNSAWSEGHVAGAVNDSGWVVAVELATGLHEHLSAGTDFGSATYEADVQATSGRAYGRRGWHTVAYQYSADAGGPRPMRGEIAQWQINGDFAATPATHSCIRFAQTRSNNLEPLNPAANPDPVPTPTGRRVAFASNWRSSGVFSDCSPCGPGNLDVKLYLADARTTGTKTFYVSTTGDTASSGFSASSPNRGFTRTFRVGNANNGSNVVVLVQPGTHQEFPAPVWTPLGGKRYYVHGDVANPSSTTLAASGNGALTMPYVTLKGLRIGGDFQLNSPARFDSILNCVTVARFDVDGADHCVIADNAIGGQRLWVGRNTGVADKFTSGMKFVGNTFSALSSNTPEPGLLLGGTRWVDSLRFERNRVTVRNQSPTAGSSLIKLRRLSRSTFLDNHFTLTNNSAGGGVDEPDFALVIRDSSWSNVWRRDTLIARGTGKHGMLWSASGGLANSVFSTQIDSCYFLVKRGIPLWFQDGADRCSLTYNVVLAEDSNDEDVNAMRVQEMRGRNIFDHNTFASSIDNALADQAGVVNFNYRAWETLAGADTIKFMNNIVYSMAPKEVGQPHSTNRLHGLYVDVTDFDQANTAELKMKAFLQSNWNLYSVWSHSVTVGDRGIGWQRSTVGSRGSSPGNAEPWETAYPTKDSLSTRGSPQFDGGGPDSVFANGDSLFNANVGPLSAAIGAGKSGATIGARTGVGVPRIELSSIDVFSIRGFDSMPETLYVAITNTGSGDLELSGLTHENPEMTAAFLEATVPVGETRELMIVMNATTNDPSTTDLRFTCNDPLRPEHLILVFRNIGGGGGPPGGGP